MPVAFLFAAQDNDLVMVYCMGDGQTASREVNDRPFIIDKNLNRLNLTTTVLPTYHCDHFFRRGTAMEYSCMFHARCKLVELEIYYGELENTGCCLGEYFLYDTLGLAATCNYDISVRNGR